MRPLLGRLSSGGCHSAVCGVSLSISGTGMVALSGTDFSISSLWGCFPDLSQGVLGALCLGTVFSFLVHLPSVFTPTVHCPEECLPRTGPQGHEDGGKVLRAGGPLLQGGRKASQGRSDCCAGASSAAVGRGFRESEQRRQGRGGQQTCSRN